MKLNLGCGNNKLDGFINIDINPNCNPDLVLDISKGKFPFDDNSVDNVVANHVLEHIGEGYLDLIKEIYRVCKDGSELNVAVPHPRHDYFLTDPTHVREITPEQFDLMNKEYNDQCIDGGFADSKLSYDLNVNFKVKNVGLISDEKYKHISSMDELYAMSRKYNNVIAEYQILIGVIK